MSTPFTITAPVIGHFDAKGTRHQNLCVEDASGCFRASGPGEGLRIRRTVMSEGAVFLSEGYPSMRTSKTAAGALLCRDGISKRRQSVEMPPSKAMTLRA